MQLRMQSLPMGTELIEVDTHIFGTQILACVENDFEPMAVHPATLMPFWHIR